MNINIRGCHNSNGGAVIDWLSHDGMHMRRLDLRCPHQGCSPGRAALQLLVEGQLHYLSPTGGEFEAQISPQNLDVLREVARRIGSSEAGDIRNQHYYAAYEAFCLAVLPKQETN